MIQKIIMRPETSKIEFLEFTSWLEQHGKLLAEMIDDDGRFVAVACFEDEIDYLAFLAATGFVKMFPVAA